MLLYPITPHLDCRMIVVKVKRQVSVTYPEGDLLNCHGNF